MGAACMTTTGDEPSLAATQTADVPIYGYEVVKVYPHDPQAFTQGLLYVDGFLFESTGRFGRSSLRKVRLETGEVVQRHDLDPRYFGEGLASSGNQLVQLTYQTHVGFVYDRESFRLLKNFTYPGEGWGLAHDGRRLIMSDGTPNLRFLDPDTLAETGRVSVTDPSGPVDDLNELEVVKGEVYANKWLTDRIAIITPATGRVAGWIDLSGLLRPRGADGDAVLNGIAYDAARDRLFVTGKLWPRLFEIRLRRRS
ncbi:MAG: glutaminyl-peptide cyclotransferase [Vicinamibacterales bacterium]